MKHRITPCSSLFALVIFILILFTFSFSHAQPCDSSEEIVKEMEALKNVLSHPHIKTLINKSPLGAEFAKFKLVKYIELAKEVLAVKNGEIALTEDRLMAIKQEGLNELEEVFIRLSALNSNGRLRSVFQKCSPKEYVEFFDTVSVISASSLSTQEKVQYLFELFGSDCSYYGNLALYGLGAALLGLLFGVLGIFPIIALFVILLCLPAAGIAFWLWLFCLLGVI